ncbi:hypothetical protein SAMN02745176_02890 [Lutispora thermophila DSM 19022]|uniref:Uncharacterized protein n=1 Tax=Lutispora thermophila DSM 19022 TaxID=1122184 RepID=A0A1M6HQA6_9FIRM|nr:hypothetical protein SAMN02745176_02890 [Lutispora thermophila DSM 19022]
MKNRKIILKCIIIRIMAIITSIRVWRLYLCLKIKGEVKKEFLFLL